MHYGTIVISLSLVLSSISLVFFYKSKSGDVLIKMTAGRLYYLSGLCQFIAIAMLLYSLISNQFAINYVYNHSSLDLPLVYKIAALWAGQEGTFLLWAFMLFILGCVVLKKNDDHIALFVITLTQLFIMLILSVYSPFNSLLSGAAIPSDGAGLNPLLQDPWMIIHPPVLFLGYAACAIPFAFAISALVRNDFETWITKSYKWIISGIAFLGIGIFLGGYWAYKVLGWGGYWGWDPVENASLIPWLLLIVLLHGVIVQKRRQGLARTNIVIAILAFISVLYGTFLTRSGVLSDFSVHSFSDLGLSYYLIFFMAVFIIGAFYLFFSRIKKIQSKPLNADILSADSLICLGIIMLLAYAFFIISGTSMPIISKIFSAKPVSIASGYYNSISIPFGLILLLLLAFIISTRDIKVIVIPAVIAVVLAVLLNLGYPFNPVSYLFMVLSFYILAQNILNIAKLHKTAVLPSRLSHIGVAVMTIGFISSNVQSVNIQKELLKDKEERIDNTGFVFKGITKEEKSSLQFEIIEGNTSRLVETPYYIAKQNNSLYREPHVEYGFLNDIYLSPLEFRNGNELLLSQGHEKEFSGIKIRFIGFDIDKQSMIKGMPKLYAKLAVKYKNNEYQLSPYVIITKGKKEAKQILLPDTQRHISLIDFDVHNKEIVLQIDPDKKKSVNESVVVDISFKRLIWLVWLGTVLISAGSLIGLNRKE